MVTGHPYYCHLVSGHSYCYQAVHANEVEEKDDGGGGNGGGGGPPRWARNI